MLRRPLNAEPRRRGRIVRAAIGAPGDVARDPMLHMISITLALAVAMDAGRAPEAEGHADDVVPVFAQG